ncbi:hypothetical protein G6F32_015407 [Rhizopus arrhizus]|nr:hypothetical protein G6F32_015407 [Rhizopus arrhizus]
MAAARWASMNLSSARPTTASSSCAGRDHGPVESSLLDYCRNSQSSKLDSTKSELLRNRTVRTGSCPSSFSCSRAHAAGHDCLRSAGRDGGCHGASPAAAWTPAAAAQVQVAAPPLRRAR